MKNRILTNSFRTMRRSFPRFLSLLIMSMLGVFVFSGLQATSPDMLQTLDHYFDDSNVYDIEIISTMGLTKEDIEYLEDISFVKRVEGAYSKDVFIKGEEEFTIHISSLPNTINQIKLLEGRLPENPNEIVVEPNFLTKNNLSLKDKVILEDENFLHSEMTIVGTVTSPLYFNSVDINQTRGTTSIGTGTIHYYAYMLDSNFQQDYYSSIYLTVENTKEEVTSSTKYEKIIDNVIQYLEDRKGAREEARYQTIYNEAKEKVVEEEKKVQTELETAKGKLDQAKKTLEASKKKLDTSKSKLDNFQRKLTKAKKELDSGNKQYQNLLRQNNIEEEKIPVLISQLETAIAELEEFKNSMVEEDSEIDLKLKELKEQLYFLSQLQTTKNQLESSKKEYATNSSSYQKQLGIYNKGVKEYNDHEKKYKEKLKEYQENKAIAEKKIEESYAQLEDIKHPVWYLYDRRDFNTYSDYIEASHSMRNLSTVFPFIFFAVAVLVSLISMNRMVEEDRLEIGTLKSLGFSSRSIMRKYFLFSFLATIFGGILGSILGLIIIPSLIFYIYGLLFDLPPLELGWNRIPTLLGFLLSAFCICGSTILTARKVLKENPSNLMRAKAPKKGKRIFLENIKFLWNPLSFSNKITIRNLFRYKKRVLVTIFGISGCAALMLCGFGIKDSIVDISSMQYEKTYLFDAMVYVKDLEDNNFFPKNQIKSISETQLVNAEIEGIDVNLFVTKDNDTLKKITRLVDQSDNEVSLKENKVILTDKLADLLHVKVGDTITIVDVDHHTFSYEISDIVKNYIGHYIYMDKNTYESNGLEYKTNVIYMNTNDFNDQEREAFSTELLSNDSILQVLYTETLIENVTDMLGSLDKVVAILIVLSAMLSFVVLYNLSNINIHERKREIATLKVLGFYHHEVDSYITKENIILTVLGIMIGLVFGTFLTNIVITTVEIERARFIHHIRFNSYLYTSILSILFTVIVNIITHFSLKRIDMIESLKSVE